MTFQDLVRILEQTTGQPDFKKYDQRFIKLRERYIQAYNELRDELKAGRLTEDEFKTGAMAAYEGATNKFTEIINSDQELAQKLTSTNKGDEFLKNYFPENSPKEFDPRFEPPKAKSFDFSRLDVPTPTTGATPTPPTQPSVPQTQPPAPVQPVVPAQPVASTTPPVAPVASTPNTGPTPVQPTPMQAQQTTKGPRLSVGPQPQTGSQLATGGIKMYLVLKVVY